MKGRNTGLLVNICYTDTMESPLLTSLQIAAARYRSRGSSNHSEGDGVDPLTVWLIVAAIVIIISAIIITVVLLHRQASRRKIYAYFGGEGYAFIESLDTPTKKAFTQLITALGVIDTQIQSNEHNLAAVDSIAAGYITPYGELIRSHVSLDWYRFIAHELDALVAYARGNTDAARVSLAQAVALRGNTTLFSKTGSALAAQWELKAS